jgi:hypothetical protein
MMLRKMIETPSLNLKENKIMFGKPNGGPSRYADSWPSNHASVLIRSITSKDSGRYDQIWG